MEDSGKQVVVRYDKGEGDEAVYLGVDIEVGSCFK